MTRDTLLLAKEYYSTFTPGSWVQVPRDGLLDGIAALETVWKRIDDLERQNLDLTVERDGLKRGGQHQIEDWIITHVDERAVPGDEGNGDALVYNLIHLLRGDGQRYHYLASQDAEIAALLGRAGKSIG